MTWGAYADVRVERAEGADACPDAASFGARLRELGGGEAEEAPDVDVHVRFERYGGGYRSAVRVASGRERALVDDDEPKSPHGASCDGLAEATSLAVRLALDLYEAKPAPRLASAVRPADAPGPSPSPLPPPQASSVAQEDAVGEISAAGTAVMGLATPFASGVRAGASLFAGRGARWSLGVTGLLLPSQTRSLGEGQVDIAVQGAGVEGCGRSPLGRTVRVALCARFEGMRVAGDARGFERSESDARPLFAASLLGRARATVARPVGVFVEAGAAVPIVRQRFSVDDVGVVYDPPFAAVIAGIGVAVDFE